MKYFQKRIVNRLTDKLILRLLSDTLCEQTTDYFRLKKGSAFFDKKSTKLRKQMFWIIRK